MSASAPWSPLPISLPPPPPILSLLCFFLSPSCSQSPSTTLPFFFPSLPPHVSFLFFPPPFSLPLKSFRTQLPSPSCFPQIFVVLGESNTSAPPPPSEKLFTTAIPNIRHLVLGRARSYLEKEVTIIPSSRPQELKALFSPTFLQGPLCYCLMNYDPSGRQDLR